MKLIKILKTGLIFLILIQFIYTLSIKNTLSLPELTNNDVIQSGSLASEFNKGYVIIYSTTSTNSNPGKLFRFTLNPLEFNSSDFRFAIPEVQISNGVVIDEKREILYTYGYNTYLGLTTYACVQSFNISSGSFEFTPISFYQIAAGQKGFLNAIINGDDGHVFTNLITRLKKPYAAKLFELDLTSSSPEIVHSNKLAQSPEPDSYSPYRFFTVQGTNSGDYYDNSENMKEHYYNSNPAVKYNFLFSSTGYNETSLITNTISNGVSNKTEIFSNFTSGTNVPFKLFPHPSNNNNNNNSYNYDPIKLFNKNFTISHNPLHFTHKLTDLTFDDDDAFSSISSEKHNDEKKQSISYVDGVSPLVATFSSSYPWPNTNIGKLLENYIIFNLQNCFFLADNIEKAFVLGSSCAEIKNTTICSDINLVPIDKDLNSEDTIFLISIDTSNIQNINTTISCVPQSASTSQNQTVFITVENYAFLVNLNTGAVSSISITNYNTIIWAEVENTEGQYAYLGVTEPDSSSNSLNSIIQVSLWT